VRATRGAALQRCPGAGPGSHFMCFEGCIKSSEAVPHPRVMSAHAMTVDACSEDLRDLAQRRVPHMIYDLIDCGRSVATPCHANETEFILT
jgi:hypothetical protein